MDARYSAYLAHFLRTALRPHARQWGEALRHTFDVAVCCESRTLAELVMALVDSGQLEEINRATYRIILEECAAQGPVVPALQASIGQEAKHTTGARLHLCVGVIPAGLVAVRFNLPTLQSLLPSVAAIVVGLLEHFQLDRYIDCFDAPTLSKLKQIYEVRGVIFLFDAIVQVAYLAGVQGDDSQSLKYLDSLVQPEDQDLANQQTPSTGRFQLEQLLDRFMASHDPYDTLKAALAHYAFFGKRVSQAEASRILKVSRSTLQSHLNLAERINVARLFSDSSR